MTSKDKGRDSYYRRTYGRSLRWYNKKLKRQKYRCAICKWKPGVNKQTGKKHNRLAVDHWHKLAKCKVKAVKLANGLWKAFNVEFDLLGYFLAEGEISFRSHVRNKAVRYVRLQLKRKSNRGLICWHCNSGLQKWKDNPAHLIAAGKYLTHYQQGMRKAR